MPRVQFCTATVAPAIASSFAAAALKSSCTAALAAAATTLASAYTAAIPTAITSALVAAHAAAVATTITSALAAAVRGLVLGPCQRLEYRVRLSPLRRMPRVLHSAAPVTGRATDAAARSSGSLSSRLGDESSGERRLPPRRRCGIL